MFYLFYQTLNLCRDKALSLVSTLVPDPGLCAPRRRHVLLGHEHVCSANVCLFCMNVFTCVDVLIKVQPGQVTLLAQALPRLMNA